MSEQATILAVDDDLDVRELLEDFLGDQGYRVITLKMWGQMNVSKHSEAEIS